MDGVLPETPGFTRFNPLPRPKQGEIEINHRIIRRICVSIRSPGRSKGRYSRVDNSPVFILFQSAPPAEARGDAKACLDNDLYLFQSAPPAEARGGETKKSHLFQSAPPAEARGDGESPAGPIRQCFNPLPRPKQGEIRNPRGRMNNPRSLKFQSAPPAEAHRPYQSAPPAEAAFRFNPLPRPKQGEIHPITERSMFQSAPPAEARGDSL